MQKINRERDISFDFIKGVLIYLVVLGHSVHIEFIDISWNNTLFDIIYSFHMPLFVFISGYFLKTSLRKPFFEMAVSKIQRLIIPTIIYTVLIYLIFSTSITYKSQGVNIGRMISIVETYWYTICIFFLSIIYWLFFRFKQGPVVIILLFLSLIILETFYPQVAAADCQVVRMFLVFGLGVIVSKKEISLDSLKYKRIVCLFSIIIIVTNRLIWGCNLSLYPIILRIFDGLFCCILSYYVLKYLIRIVHKIKLFNVFIYLGEKSLAIYLIHMLFYSYLSYNQYFRNESTIESLLISIILTSICVGIIRCLDKVLSQKYKYILGI